MWVQYVLQISGQYSVFVDDTKLNQILLFHQKGENDITALLEKDMNPEYTWRNFMEIIWNMNKQHTFI